MNGWSCLIVLLLVCDDIVDQIAGSKELLCIHVYDVYQLKNRTYQFDESSLNVH